MSDEKKHVIRKVVKPQAAEYFPATFDAHNFVVADPDGFCNVVQKASEI
jgi:hypothetical protein